METTIGLALAAFTAIIQVLGLIGSYNSMLDTWENQPEFIAKGTMLLMTYTILIIALYSHYITLLLS